MVRKLYDWVLSWGDSRYAKTALFILAFAESSFFPVPPDILLIALCIGDYKKWFSFALVCSLGSIFGGVAGYMIGNLAYNTVGSVLMAFVGKIVSISPDVLLKTAQDWFNTEKTVAGITAVWGPWAVAVAGFTPIPYKVFTISAGFFKMNLAGFILASAVSRSTRFFIVAALIGLTYKYFGDKIQKFIDKYFNLLSILFVVLLVGGFMILKYIIK